MLPAEFEYARPESLDQAVEVLASRSDARPLAGGQSFVNVLKMRAANPDLLVDLSRLEELRGIAIRDGLAEIGAGVTYAEIAASESMKSVLPRLSEIAAHTVDVQVRNRGTVGGNCCYADPSSNFAPILIALSAEMNVVSREGERTIPAEAFFLGPFETALGPKELLRSICVPLPPPTAAVGYTSFSLMRDSWAIARAAVVVDCDESISLARVVLAAVEPTPSRQLGVEAALRQQLPTDATLESAAANVGELPNAIADVHGGAAFRRKLAVVVITRALREAFARLEMKGRDGA